MQTPTLPIQISGASAAPAPARPSTASADGAPQFSQALKHELAQRQNPAAPAPQAQAKPAAPAPQAQAKPAAPAKAKDSAATEQDGAAKASPAEPAQQAAAPAGKQVSAVEDEGAEQAAEAFAASPAELPVADMLALVASFNQPLQSAVAAAPQALPATVAVAVETAGAAVPATPALAPAVVAQPVPEGALPLPPADSKAVAADTDFATSVASASAALAPAAHATTAAATRAAAPVAGSGEPAAPDRGQQAEPALAAAKAQPEPSQFASLRAREGADQAGLKDIQAPAAAAPQSVAAPVSAAFQQAALAPAHAAGAAAADKIAARVGTPGWDQQVGQKIVWMVAGKEQSAALTLNPPDMGPLQVVLNVSNDQASVTFSSAQPEVRQALENAMPKLREMMSESGIALGEATVNAGMPDQRQAQGEQARPGNGQGGARFETNGSAVQAAARHAERPAARGERQGLVDTFA